MAATLPGFTWWVKSPSHFELYRCQGSSLPLHEVEHFRTRTTGLRRRDCFSALRSGNSCIDWVLAVVISRHCLMGSGDHRVDHALPSVTAVESHHELYLAPATTAATHPPCRWCTDNTRNTTKTIDYPGRFCDIGNMTKHRAQKRVFFYVKDRYQRTTKGYLSPRGSPYPCRPLGKISPPIHHAEHEIQDEYTVEEDPILHRHVHVLILTGESCQRVRIRSSMNVTNDPTTFTSIKS